MNLGGYSTTRNDALLMNPKIREPLSTKNQMPTVNTIDAFHSRIGSNGNNGST
jgi:hypothetical protein